MTPGSLQSTFPHSSGIFLSFSTSEWISKRIKYRKKLSVICPSCSWKPGVRSLFPHRSRRFWMVSSAIFSTNFYFLFGLDLRFRQLLRFCFATVSTTAKQSYLFCDVDFLFLMCKLAFSRKAFGFRKETATRPREIDSVYLTQWRQNVTFFCHEKEVFLKISVTNPLAGGVLLWSHLKIRK